MRRLPGKTPDKVPLSGPVMENKHSANRVAIRAERRAHDRYRHRAGVPPHKQSLAPRCIVKKVLNDWSRAKLSWIVLDDIE
jgi:hypothetical protein